MDTRRIITSISLLIFLILKGCTNERPEPSVETRINSRDFPSVFQAWNPADNLDEDPLVTLARHDLLFHGPDYYGLEWDHSYVGLAEDFTRESIGQALKFRKKVLELNPAMVFLLEVRYRDAPVSYLPDGHDWWMKDTAGIPVPGWEEGGFVRLDLQDPSFRENVARKCAAAIRSGVVDGVMLDWWNEEEFGRERIAILERIRELVPSDALIMVNSNHRQIPGSAPMVNGLFMECYRTADPGDWEQVRTTLLWAEEHLRKPTINCVEAWFDDSRDDLYKMRAVTTLVLTHSDGYALFSDPNRLPEPDHLHNWYPFWDAKLGKPEGAMVECKDGSFRRSFSGGTAVYNPMGDQTVQLRFGEPVIRVSTGQQDTVHRLEGYDGDIFLPERSARVDIQLPKKSPRAGFAAGEIMSSAGETGLDPVVVEMKLNKNMGEQSFVIRSRNNKIIIQGGDETGLMYGGLELAEMIRIEGGLPDLEDPVKQEPYIRKRGLKFNIPLDIRTPSYQDAGDAAQNNIIEMWNFDFWKAYLDMMARNRYNVLTLWNSHPFPSMIKLEEYPEIVLENVCGTSFPLDTDRVDEPVAEFIAGCGVSQQVLDNLVILKEMTMEQKIAYWRKVMRYAKDRGVEIYFITWNIKLNSVAPPGWYREQELKMGDRAKYGINNDQENPRSIEYLRKSVKEFLVTYPDVAGIGVTAGENMEDRNDEYDREKWLWKTYGEGVLEAKKEQPGREIKFIHRFWQSGVDRIMDDFISKYPDPIHLSYKYARARMYAIPDPHWADEYIGQLRELNLKSWWNIRNDDIFHFRWGDPEFASAFIKNLPPEKVTEGYFMGSDGYVWGREFISKHPKDPRELEIDKHWYNFMLWGRMGYNPNISEKRLKGMLALHYPGTDIDALYQAWAIASGIPSQVTRFHWHNWDFQWAVEGCLDLRNGFHTVEDFITNPVIEGKGLLTIPAFVQLQKNNEPVNGTTPLEVSARLDSMASRVLEFTLTQHTLEGKISPSYDELIYDLRAWAYMGRYYADKIRGAYYVHAFRSGLDSEGNEKAVQSLQEALDKWKLYAEAAGRNYHPQFLAKTRTIDWNTITGEVKRDLDMVSGLGGQSQANEPSSIDPMPPYIQKITTFGQRCDWSHDGERLIFLEKTFGDVYEVEVATGKLTPLTHHFFHEGFVRALYLANGDILLSGSRTFDAREPWKSRSPEQAELWVLKRDLSEPPTPLGVHCKEGPTCSRKQMKIAWTVDDIYMGEIVYREGVPLLTRVDTIVRSSDLPGAVHGWRLETQNFRPPEDKELIFNAHFPSVEYEAEVMGIILKTGEIVNYSQRPDRYDEPEGIFPDGEHILVESTRHHPKRAENRTTWDYIDIYKLKLDGSGDMERITYFNKDSKYKATNPVVSDDGRYMAFQYSLAGETTGIGHGLLIWDFEKEKEYKIRQPNIVLVFVDDLGYGDLGCYGQELIRTPNIDRMAEEGIRFTDFYSASPVCAPSRYSLITGKDAGSAFIRHNINVLPWGQLPIPDEEITIAELLKEAGYVTAAMGKWSLGSIHNSGDPLMQGFDHFFGYYCQCYAHNYYPEMLWRNKDTVRLRNETIPVEVNYVDYPLSYATKKVEYSAEIIFDEALDFIENNREDPFFLYFASTLPHSNGEAPPDERFEVPDWGVYADSSWLPHEKGYASMVSMLDRQMGRFMKKLRELGLDNNTLLIFTSDNGPTKFAEIFESAGELRGRKRDLYEGGIRVPFVAWWPGTIPAGQVTDLPSSTVDLMPTFSELAGTGVPETAGGISLLPALKGERIQDTGALYWEFYEGDRSPKQAVRSGDWKLIRFRFYEPGKEEVELYNLKNDIRETTNIAGTNPEKVKELINIMEHEHKEYPNR